MFTSKKNSWKIVNYTVKSKTERLIMLWLLVKENTYFYSKDDITTSMFGMNNEDTCGMGNVFVI